MLTKKNSFFKVWIYHTLFFIKKLFLKQDKQKYILLINYNNLGDLVCDSPSIRNIRKNFPDHKIILLVRNSQSLQFMSACPYVDKVIEMPHSHDSFKKYRDFTKKYLKYNFDFSIQFTRPFKEFYRTYLPYLMCIKKRLGLIQKGFEKIYNHAFTMKCYLDNTTTRTEESLMLLKLLNVNIDNDKTECFWDAKEAQKFDYKNYIIIQTCATLQCRMWHKTRFVELINKITEKFPSITILLTGTNNEAQYISLIQESCKHKSNIVSLCNLNIASLLQLIKDCKLLITNDTGPLHFARTLNVPIISIFGISPPQYLFKTNTNDCIAIRGDNICPNDCDIKLLEKNCQKIYKNNMDEMCCINNVTVDEVFTQLKMIQLD